MYFRDCKTLSVFERKIPLTFRVQISPRPCIMPGFLPNFFIEYFRRRKSKDWLAWSHDNVSKWGEMCSIKEKEQRLVGLESR
jgi:hypothetical protein